jgi:hypothetical protein
MQSFYDDEVNSVKQELNTIIDLQEEDFNSMKESLGEKLVAKDAEIT